MNTNAEVLAAEEALERAKAVRDGANATLKAAMQAVFDADQALQKAKVRADDHLPRADSCAAGWAWAAGMQALAAFAVRDSGRGALQFTGRLSFRGAL